MSKVKNFSDRRASLVSVFHVVAIVLRYLMAWVEYRIFGLPKHQPKPTLMNNKTKKHELFSVSIVIPTRDRVDLLRKSVKAAQSLSGHKRFEIVILNNNSAQDATFEYFNELKIAGVRILDCPGEFNFAKMHNDALKENKSDFLFFLNNDAIALTADWLSRLLKAASLDPSNSIIGMHQVGLSNRTNHAGIYVGRGGFVRQIDKMQNQVPNENQISLVEAVSFSACLVSRHLFSRLNGFDEALSVGLNDVDFCLRASASGARIFFDSGVTFQHEVSATRGSILRAANFKRAIVETVYFAKKWAL